MWREEPGCFEMLLAFYKENELDANKSYRDFLFDLLECYEERKCVKATNYDSLSSRKRRRLSDEEGMRQRIEKVSETSRRKPGPASKSRAANRTRNPPSDDEDPMEVGSAPPPNGTNLAPPSSTSKPGAEPASSSSSRREKVTPHSSAARPIDISKQYVRVPDHPGRPPVHVPDPKPLPTLGLPLRAAPKLLPAPASKNRPGQRAIAPNPASILGNLSQLGGMFGAGEDFGNGFPCILCSKSFDSEETYQRHDCFAAAAMAAGPALGSGASLGLDAFKCRVCPLSFPSDHRRLRHERNAHGLNV